MALYLSKLLPLLVYPLGLACLLLLLGLLLRRTSPWLKAPALAALLLLLAASNSWTSSGLIRWLEWRYLPPAGPLKADVIVVLGGGTLSAQYPRRMVEVNGAGDRVIYAAALYKQGSAPYILASGGNLDWSPAAASPAEEMAELLQMMGVPETAIWLEKESRNTAENALFSRRLLEQKGVSKIILVTSAMHMPRAAAMFARQGLDVIPAPTDYSLTQAEWEQLLRPSLPVLFLNLLPSAGNLSATTRGLKEVLGILYEQWIGDE